MVLADWELGLAAQQALNEERLPGGGPGKVTFLKDGFNGVGLASILIIVKSTHLRIRGRLHANIFI